MQLENLLLDISEYFNQSCKEQTKQTMTKEEIAKFTINHFYYLEAIKKLINPTFSELSQKMQVSKPAVTTMVNKLEKQGYVQKIQSNQDKRSFHICLTKKGEQIFAGEAAIFHNFAQKIRKHFSSEDVMQIEFFLKRLIEITKKEDI